MKLPENMVKPSTSLDQEKQPSLASVEKLNEFAEAAQRWGYAQRQEFNDNMGIKDGYWDAYWVLSDRLKFLESKVAKLEGVLPPISSMNA